MNKFKKNYRKGTWNYEHQDLVDEVIAMFMAGATIQAAIDEHGIPRTTAQGLKARVTKWQNEQAANKAVQLTFPPCMGLWGLA